MLRIGQFSDSYPPTQNGVASFVYEHHSEMLSRPDLEPSVFTFGRGGIDKKSKVYYSRGIPLLNSGFQISYRLSKRAEALARKRDVIHIHDPLGIAGVALAIARREKIPVLTTFHTRQDIYMGNYILPIRPLLWVTIKNVMRLMVVESGIVTAPSEDTAAWIRAIAPERAKDIHVVVNGIRLEMFREPETAGQPLLSRADLNIPAERTVFMYVGRLTPEKNLMFLADAFVRAVQGGANAHWLVAGEGQLRPLLEKKVAPVADRVTFLGAVPRARLPGMLCIADAFATASISEANPVSVIEALASGKPYVGLKAGFWREFAHDPPAGLLAERDEEALAQCIAQTCDDPHRRAEMSHYAQMVSERFDIRNTTERYLELYRTLR
jgi:glycosyltransferase involved in cell wall biosynthesis